MNSGRHKRYIIFSNAVLVSLHAWTLNLIYISRIAITWKIKRIAEPMYTFTSFKYVSRTCVIRTHYRGLVFHQEKVPACLFQRLAVALCRGNASLCMEHERKWTVILNSFVFVNFNSWLFTVVLHNLSPLKYSARTGILHYITWCAWHAQSPVIIAAITGNWCIWSERRKVDFSSLFKIRARL